MSNSELYEMCNDSELYQLTRSAGLVVAPGTPREKLMAYLAGDEEPTDVEHEVDEWRYAIMQFVLDHRKVLETQLKCPAKTMDPRACFQCVDAQVVSCTVQNEASIELIKLHKKPIPRSERLENTTMGTTVYTLENAPRTVEALIKAGTFPVRQIADLLGLVTDAQQKQAWGGMPLEARATEVAKRLKEHDAGSGGTAAAPATAPAAPAAAPPVAATTVAAVAPEALAAAQAATTATPATGRRTTKGPTAAAAPATNGVASHATTNGTAAAPASDITPQLTALRSLIETQSQATLGTLNAVKQTAEGSTTRIDALEQAVARQAETLNHMLMILLMMGEQILSASRTELLGAAIEDSGSLGSIYEDCAPGKAA